MASQTEYKTKAKKKSVLNKTIDFETKPDNTWLKRCLNLSSYTIGSTAAKKSATNGTAIQPLTYESVINKTIIADTFKLLPFLPAACVDLLIVDPPYNLTKEYHGTTFSRQKESDYANYTRAWIDAVFPLLKKNASVYVCCDWRSSMIIAPVLAEKLHIKNRISWQREKGRGSRTNWKNGMEDIWFAVAGAGYTFNADAVKIRKRVIAPYRQNGQPKDWEHTGQGNFRNTCASNFWDDISIPYWSMPENTAHPAQKPEKLLAKLILASSNAGDTVLDPFAGSGSTAVTAKKLGRRYIGIEQNPRYCAWAEYRLEQADSKPSIQGFENGVFYERNSKPKSKKKKN